MRSLITIAAAAAVVCTGTLGAQDAPEKKIKPLNVGDKAPAIKVDTWVKGKPVTKFEEGKVYVMEFWATWCGPCIAGIPKLTEMQREYKDKGVTIVGTAIWQREKTQEARVEKVESFVKSQGDKMDYTIAVDDDRWMSDHWMRPAGRNGIPSAFIVGKKGTIEWLGHPGTMSGPLEAILAGTFDHKAFAEKEAAERRWRNQSRRIMTEVARARQAGDGAKALAVLDEAVKEFPDAPQLQQERYRLMLQYADSASVVSEYGRSIAKANWDDPQFLNAISWWTVDDKMARHRDLDAALTWARRADELTDHKDPQIIDTVARCWWEKGETAKAIELQRRAVELAPGNLKGQLEVTLEEYLRDAQAT